MRQSPARPSNGNGVRIQNTEEKPLKANIDYAFAPAPQARVPIAGREEWFPVRRIYCVGRNYAAHVREMGGQPERSPPVFFSKPADAIVANGATVPYPPGTNDLHHEIELVVALDRGGRDLSPDDASELVFGYAVGIDLTRRDLQSAARKAGGPWDCSKGFDRSAPITAISPRREVGDLTAGRIRLSVNESPRQEADLADMIWAVPEILSALSRLFELHPGDLVFTGTPAGVASLQRGDIVEGSIDGLEPLRITIA